MIQNRKKYIIILSSIICLLKADKILMVERLNDLKFSVLIALILKYFLNRNSLICIIHNGLQNLMIIFLCENTFIIAVYVIILTRYTTPNVPFPIILSIVILGLPELVEGSCC